MYLFKVQNLGGGALWLLARGAEKNLATQLHVVPVILYRVPWLNYLANMYIIIPLYNTIQLNYLANMYITIPPL